MRRLFKRLREMKEFRRRRNAWRRDWRAQVLSVRIEQVLEKIEQIEGRAALGHPDARADEAFYRRKLAEFEAALRYWSSHAQ